MLSSFLISLESKCVSLSFHVTSTSHNTCIPWELGWFHIFIRLFQIICKTSNLIRFLLWLYLRLWMACVCNSASSNIVDIFISLPCTYDANALATEYISYRLTLEYCHCSFLCEYYSFSDFPSSLWCGRCAKVHAITLHSVCIIIFFMKMVSTRGHNV